MIYKYRDCSGLTLIEVDSGNPKYDSRDNCNAIIETNTNTLIVGCNNTVIPNSVTSIGYGAFCRCSGLTSVTIPNSVTSIGESAFAGCSGLVSVTIPNSVTNIGGSAFSGCSGLTSVTIGNSVTSIGEYAFNDCSSLTSVTIPNSVTSIGYSAFEGCSGLTTIEVESGNTKYDSRDNCNAIIETNTNTLISGCMNTVIPNSVTSIGSNAFFGCKGLTSVTIGNSVTSIGRDAFYGCKSLYYVYNSSELDITKGATSHGYVAYYAKQVYDYEEMIDDYLFTTDEETGVHNLCGYVGNATELNLPKNYKGNNYCIADGVFRDCINVTSVTIPNSVTSIGYYAFSGCSGLTAVHITDLSAWCKIKFDDYYSNPTDYAHHLYLNGEEIINLVIPDDITSIEDNAFRGCSALTSVTIPNSVTSIGDWAFRDCSGLTSVTIPNSVTSISKFGFFGCTGLTAIKVDSENTKYDSRDNCNAIIETETNTLITGCKNTVIPNSVTIIGEYAFYDLTGMPTITIPKSVEKICYGALAYWDNSPRDSLGIKNINIEELSQAFKIKEQNGAEFNYFLSYRKLLLNGKEISELVIPEGIDTVSGILSGASQFKSLVIPKTVKEISFSIFENCKDLMYVYSNSTTPPVMQTGWVGNGFSDNTFNNATLYVPKDGYDLYTSTAPWSSFANIKIFTNTTDITFDETSIKMVEGETVTLSATVYPEDATDKTIVWTSSDESIVKISETGVVTALKAGKVTITASSKVCPTVTATCEITVNTKITTITLNKAAAEIVEGESLSLTATVSPENATDKTITWTSSDENIAKVSETGVVTALKAGKVTITALSKVCPTVTATCEITVNTKISAITLNKAAAEIVEGESLVLTATVSPEDATDKTVTWISSDESIAKISENGVVTALKAGRAIITASSKVCPTVTATCEVVVKAKTVTVTGITLDKTTAEITEGETLTLTATVSPENATDKTVTWISSDESIAKVINGIVIGVKAGKATIIASCGDKVATCEITVNAKVIPATGITLDKTTAELTEGETLTLTATVTPEDATDKTVVWTSSDETVATVANGVVTALKAGKATITAKAGEVSATCEITVNAKVIPATGIALDKTTAELTEGETLTLTATVSPEDATDKTVTWTSSDETVATVVDGVVTALKAGKVTITAKAGDVSATCEITVNAKVIPATGIALDKTTAEMIEGETLTLTATVTPEDATDKTVTWTSSDETVAKVVNGVVSALKTGKATITATSGDVSATCEITVIPATGINGVVCNDGYAAGNVYTVAGNLVCRKGEKLSSLPKGLYIVDGKKIIVK